MSDTRQAAASGAPGDAGPGRRWLRRLRALVGWCSWLYVAGVCGIWLLLHQAAERWWPATVLLFGPRWVWLGPLVLLVPAAALIRRRSLGPLAIGLIMVVGPVMGYCLPWGTLLARRPDGYRVRVLTCNVHYHQLKPAALAKLIAEARPDIVALQGWAGDDPMTVFVPDDWYMQTRGELLLASRYPIGHIEVLAEESGRAKASCARYELAAPDRTLHFVTLHLPSPRNGLEAVMGRRWEGAGQVERNTASRWRESDSVSRWVAQLQGPLLIAGDFNLTTDSAIYRQYWSRYGNAFSWAGLGFGYTCFTREGAVRIDHILSGPSWQCRRCWVGSDVGSPHRPLIADMCWVDPVE